MKNIKKLLLFALLCTLSIFLFVGGKTIKVKADTSYDFANITEEQSLEFLDDHNIEIPAIFSGNREQIGNFAKNIMQITYSNPTYEFVFNYDKTLNFANDIKQAVLPYVSKQTVSPQSCSPYYLQYNKVKNSNGEWVTRGGAWDDRWENYNCYAFSICRNEVEPFYLTRGQYQPGDMSGTEKFDSDGSIEKLANLIKKDIEAMGYNNVALSTTIPSITNNQSLICIRKNLIDYHFMKYDLATNAWYHKPGKSAILKYNGTPNNSEIWYGEISKYGIERRNINDYDSDIYFIKYDKNIVNVSSSTSNLTKNVHVNAGKDTILEIRNNVNNKYYTFSISAPSAIKAELYDDEMGLFNTYTDMSVVVFNKPLTTKQHYLKLNFASVNVSGNISVNISAHTHQYIYTATDSAHLASCGCGYTENQPHTYVNPEKKDGTQHIVHCVCGASKAEDHTYSESYVWIDGYSHRAYCECGAATKRGHAVASGAKPPYTCIFCNGSAQVGITEYSLSIPIGATQITENGSYVLPNGITIVAEADLEDFLNGTPKLLKHNLVLSA